MQVSLNGQTVAGFTSNKARGLLAYLALHAGQKHARQELADLLWPDGKKPLSNLREALSNLRKVLDDKKASPSFFIVDDDFVQFNLTEDDEVDVNNLEELLKACRQHPHRRLQSCHSCKQRLEQAVDLYRGGFLEGLVIEGSERWQEFLTLNREHYRRFTYEALMNLATHHELLQQYDVAEAYAQRWITLEPFDEDAHRLMMRVLAFQGKRRAALNQYELLRRALEIEGFDLGPEPETVLLYEQIRTNALVPPAPIVVKLPVQTTRFIGRERELSEITSLLEDPRHRLISVLGPGGVGKTRLAIAAAARQRGVFADGIYFVSCVAIHSSETVVITIARELNLALEGPEDPTVQLLRYLQTKEVLIVLDNLEHLLDTALVDLLVQIQHRAPHVSILATSRARLNLASERQILIDGLEVPAQNQLAELDNFSAVQLFVEQAQRVRPDFVLQDANRASVGNICRMLEGMPLALELAANWVCSAPISRIEQEIADGLKQEPRAELQRAVGETPAHVATDSGAAKKNVLEFLRSSEPDRLERHRSMYFVFDHSYRLLSKEEQSVFRQLSVFRGHFSFEAAEQVAGATLPVLKSLVDKSLLRLRVKDDRYELHELLRQYAGRKLRASEAVALCDRHLSYYTNLAKQFGGKITTSEMFDALAQLDSELDNLYAALDWSLTDPKRAESGIEIIGGTFFYWYFRNLWHEARDWAEKFFVLPNVERETVSWARVLAIGGGSAWLQGDNHVANARLKESAAILRRNADINNLAYVLTILGYNSLSQGDIDSAEEYIKEGVALFRKSGDEWGLGMSVTALGEVFVQNAKYNLARECFNEGMALSVQHNYVGTGYIHAYLGKVLRYQGDLARAKSESESALALARTYGIKRYMALALENLGRICNAQNEPREAAKLFAEGITMFQAVGDLEGVAMCIEGSATTQVLLKKAPLASWLLGSADALRKRIQVPLPAPDRPDYDHTLSDIRGLIDGATFASAWQRGAMTPTEDVIAVLTGAAEEPAL